MEGVIIANQQPNPKICFGAKKKPPGSLYHLSHGQREPGGSHSLVPEDKIQPVPDGSVVDSRL